MRQVARNFVPSQIEEDGVGIAAVDGKKHGRGLFTGREVQNFSTKNFRPRTGRSKEHLGGGNGNAAVRHPQDQVALRVDGPEHPLAGLGPGAGATLSPSLAACDSHAARSGAKPSVKMVSQPA